MKISIPNLLGTLAAVQTGTMQGKLQGQREREALEFQQFQQAAQADQMRRQTETEGLDQQTRTLQAALQTPGLAPESKQQLTGQLLQLLQRPRPQADYGALTQGFNPQNRMIAPYRNIPAPAAQQPVQMPELKYDSPYQDDVLSGLQTRINSALALATEQGDTELMQTLNDLSAGVQGRKLAPDAATAQLNTVYGRLKAKGAGKQLGAQVKEAADWLDTMLGKGMIPEQSAAAASELSGTLGSLDLSTPQGQDAARSALQRWAEFRKGTALQPSGTERYNAKTAESLEASRIDTRNKGYLDAIQRAKTPGERLRAIDQQRQFAARYPEVVQPYGGEDYDPNPRSVQRAVAQPRPGDLATAAQGAATTGPNPGPMPAVSREVPETAAEVKLRRLAVATEDLEDPQAKEKAQRDLYKQYTGFLKSPAFASLPEAQQKAWVEQTNTLGEQVGAPNLPEVHPGVSPSVKAMLAERGKDRELRKFLADRNFTLAQTKEAFDQEIGRAKLGLERLRAATSQSGAGGKDSTLRQRIIGARQRVNNLEQQINKLNLEAIRNKDPEMQAKASAAAAALIPNLEALNREYQAIATQAEKSGVTPTAPTAPTAPAQAASPGWDRAKENTLLAKFRKFQEVNGRPPTGPEKSQIKQFILEGKLK